MTIFKLRRQFSGAYFFTPEIGFKARSSVNRKELPLAAAVLLLYA
jgi:hypothetical protein